MFRNLFMLSALNFAADMDFVDLQLAKQTKTSYTSKRVPRTKGKRHMSQKERGNRRKAKRRRR